MLLVATPAAFGLMLMVKAIRRAGKGALGAEERWLLTPAIYCGAFAPRSGLERITKRKEK